MLTRKSGTSALAASAGEAVPSDTASAHAAAASCACCGAALAAAARRRGAREREVAVGRAREREALRLAIRRSTGARQRVDGVTIGKERVSATRHAGVPSRCLLLAPCRWPVTFNILKTEVPGSTVYQVAGLACGRSHGCLAVAQARERLRMNSLSRTKSMSAKMPLGSRTGRCLLIIIGMESGKTFSLNPRV